MKDYTVANITNIAEGRTVYLDRWWLCKDGDPREALFYKLPNGQLRPQCNHNYNIVATLELAPDGYSPVFVPIAYVPYRVKPNLYP